LRAHAAEKSPHPGEHLRHDYLEPLGLSVTGAARTLGIARQTLNNVVNGASGISPEMAIRLSKAFGGSPQVWLGMQMNYDLARAMRNAEAIKVKRVVGARRAAA
jgi:addiction module HigA family antidote